MQKAPLACGDLQRLEPSCMHTSCPPDTSPFPNLLSRVLSFAELPNMHLLQIYKVLPAQRSQGQLVCLPPGLTVLHCCEVRSRSKYSPNGLARTFQTIFKLLRDFASVEA